MAGVAEADAAAAGVEGSSTNGQIIILNGAPRSGKSSIAAAIQRHFDGVWVNLGVDGSRRALDPRHQPGIGLRPGGEGPDLEPTIVSLYAALYESVAAHSRLGLNVVVDVGHHDGYSQPRGILADCARRLDGLPALLVGVRCPIEVAMERLNRGEGYEKSTADDPIPAPVRRFHQAVHDPGIYDLEVDTSQQSPEACAQAIRDHLGANRPATALQRLAAPAAD